MYQSTAVQLEIRDLQKERASVHSVSNMEKYELFDTAKTLNRLRRTRDLQTWVRKHDKEDVLSTPCG